MSTPETEIFDTLAGMIVEALRVAPSAVTPEARLFLDLDAESIDIVDIRFRIEEEFGLKIRQEEFFTHLGDNLSRKEIGERFTVGSLVTFIRMRLQEHH